MSSRWSLRSRLTFAVVGTAGAVLVTLAILLYTVVRQTAHQQHDEAMASRARALAASAEHDDEGYDVSLPLDPEGVSPTYVEVWKPNGEVLARSATLKDTDLSKTDGSSFSDTVLPDGREGRSLTLRFLPHDEAHNQKAETMTLVLAEGTEAVDRTVGAVRSWFLILGVAALVAIAFTTWWLLLRGLRPLTSLAAQIDRIDDRQLATRLPSDGQPIELEVPVRKLNDLLARLDASFVRERQFTADVSHELRTPLAGLQTLIEVTALADRSTAEYRSAFEAALVAVKQLAALVENLLMLARLDDDNFVIDTRDVELQALVDECWQPHAAIAAARSLHFSNSVSADVIARTDREKLRIVIGNLLANAAEYTEPGGWIDVAAVDGGVVEVVDSGPAIPADELERVFDRLWRGDLARSTTGAHCGIGLSLARVLCERLSLSLTASSSEQRVSFRIA